MRYKNTGQTAAQRAAIHTEHLTRLRIVYDIIGGVHPILDPGNIPDAEYTQVMGSIDDWIGKLENRA